MRTTLLLVLLLGPVISAGCASVPEEVARIHAENELLKAELEVIKRNCSYYRQLDVRPDAGDGP